MPWREGPSSAMTKDERGRLDLGEGPSAVFFGGTEGPTVEGIKTAGDVDSAVQEVNPRKRARLMPANTDTDSEDGF